MFFGDFGVEVFNWVVLVILWCMLILLQVVVYNYDGLVGVDCVFNGDCCIDLLSLVLQCLGKLWGGNLVMMVYMVGYLQFFVIDGGILFLEDVNEYLFWVECMIL